MGSPGSERKGGHSLLIVSGGGMPTGKKKGLVSREKILLGQSYIDPSRRRILKEKRGVSSCIVLGVWEVKR